MTTQDLTHNNLPQSSVLSSFKKKYSKVNQTLRQRFLSCIIQHNMSIKDASQMLNINYSSAKAILASHRKKINGPKNEVIQGSHALFRALNHNEDSFAKLSIICSTGGRQTSRVGNIGKTKPIHKSSPTLVIIPRLSKQSQSLENTSNSLSD